MIYIWYMAHKLLSYLAIFDSPLTALRFKSFSLPPVFQRLRFLEDTMKILIIDDEKTVADLMEKKFVRWGHTVETSDRGDSALQKVSRFLYDIAFVDIFLPDSHGADLICEFKILRPEMGIVAMTGHNSRELELKIRGLGILFYLIKPFDMGFLKVILDHISQKTTHEKITFQKDHEVLITDSGNKRFL